MTEITVALEDRSYRILIENGLFGKAGAILTPYARNGRLVIVSEETVWGHYGLRFSATLAKAGIEAVPIIVPARESSKDWATLGAVIERLLTLGIERSDHVVALGGGMVGDLAGLAAALVKRGCGLIQIPTTLLAQVDSSVGGKTAINAAAGKNLIGVFHQPSLVLIDPEMLRTLAERELRAGYAEVLKYGLVADSDFFAWCEAQGAAIIAGDGAQRLHAIASSVRMKALIVGEDERETAGRRALLNFGHSFAHALEAEAGFSGALLHGEAVAVGMTLAMRLSAAEGLGREEEAERVSAHLAATGLPTTIRQALGTADPARLLAHMRNDKKNRSGRIALILSRGIGRAFQTDAVPESRIFAFLEAETNL